MTFEKFARTYSSASSRLPNDRASVVTSDHAPPVHTAKPSVGRTLGGRLVGASVALRSEPMTNPIPCLRVKIPIWPIVSLRSRCLNTKRINIIRKQDKGNSSALAMRQITSWVKYEPMALLSHPNLFAEMR
jgi:hypothetical protein